LIDSGKKLAKTDNIRFYLLKALRNKLLRHIAKASKINSGTNETEFSLLESIESELIKKETEEAMQQRVVAAIKKLSVKQQEIIYLRFYNDMPFPDIAALMEVNIQTVRNLLSRAIKSLKEDFEKNNVNKGMIFLIMNFA
jgi:RNA polymerase sigma factor (sigma-70 family)